MKPRDLPLAWRLLSKEPAYSAVAILGLAVALATCFLLAGLVRYAWTYNAAVRDAGRIVVVKERRNLFPRPDWGESAPPPLAAAAVRQGLAEAATSARSIDLGARVGNRFVKISPSVVDPNYLAFFGVPTIAGDAAAALARPDALLLAAAGVGTSVLAGAYPAWLAARVPASVALGGRAGDTVQGVHMRRVLTVAQFAAAIGLVAASLAVWWQAAYASAADPGLDPSRQLVLSLPQSLSEASGTPASSAIHAFKAERLVALIALLACARQAVAAMRMAPALALRDQ